jgi:peptidoglycan/xylan/chitin deacetylase (PgdA/CDA1 family)
VHNVNFHGVGPARRELDDGEAHVWLSCERFEATLDALCGRGDVRLSFDDGNSSDVERALPALLERGLTATFFVLAGRLDDPHHLGVDDLARLVDAGMTIGSHGLHHRDWRRCSDAELDAELRESRRVLEATLCCPVTRAAIPFGSYDRRVLARARREGGYERVFTSDGGPARRDAWLQARTTVCDDDVFPAMLAQPPTGRARVAHALKRAVKRQRGRWP